MKYFFKTTPTEYQRKNFEKFKDNENLAVFWTVGTGKTKFAIDLMSYKFLKKDIKQCLVIAPKSLGSQWCNEQLPTHCGVEYKTFMLHTLKSSRAKNLFYQYFSKPELVVLVANTELFSKRVPKEVEDFLKNSRTLIILDEASQIKSPKALRTKNLIKLRKAFKNYPSLALTGTPMTKSASTLWSIYEFLSPEILNKSYYAFCAQFSYTFTVKVNTPRGLASITQDLSGKVWRRVKSNWNERINAGCKDKLNLAISLGVKFGMSAQDVFDIAKQDFFVGVKNYEVLKKLTEPFTSTLSNEETFFLPSKRRISKVVELTNDQKAVLKQLNKSFCAVFNEDELTLNSAAELLLRKLQICGGFFPSTDNLLAKVNTQIKFKQNPKLLALLETLEEIPTSESVIVFAVFVQELELISEVLRDEGFRVGCIWGKFCSKERETTIDLFKRGEIDVLVCNPSVAGYGLNLQEASVQVWFSRNFNVEQRIQGEGRICRKNSASSEVTIFDIVADEPAEHFALTANLDGNTCNEMLLSLGNEEFFKRFLRYDYE